ncbi:MAG: teicoplanin resistance protein VanZ [Sphingomonas sanxanigenens]|uniref:Teicoplanin resistance protein VanZ n=1 Tax=Sphingomonas sanxanigenens TaxID=397260 RepID=A0A2W5C647_9SPHN|nr:MAG: teicoplanin resistance protein VanZ [Sphingomonas sanxanigenens]
MPRLIKAGFWVALAVTLYFAWAPHPPTLIHNDKSQHELAFATLAIGWTLAWPRARWWQVALALAALGGLIEIVQGLPFVHRDEDINDWYADVAAILLGLAAAHGLLAILPKSWFSAGSAGKDV